MPTIDYGAQPIQGGPVRRRLHLVAAILPLAPVLVLYGFVLSARLHSGQWPSLFKVRPNAIPGFTLYSAMIGPAFSLWLGSPIMILLPNILGGGQYWRKAGGPLNALFIALFIVAMVIIVGDLGDFYSWADD